MLRIPTPSAPNQDLRPGDLVRFSFDGAQVRAEVRQVDQKAHPESPLGLPHSVRVIEAEEASGYVAGRQYTIRAACLVAEDDISHRPLLPLRAGTLVSMAGSLMAAAASSAPGAPRYLVGYLREGGQFPVQGVLLVQADGLTEANGIATQTLEAELATDIAEGREQDGAMVMLVNAAEVTAGGGNGVLGQVSW